MPKPFCCVYKAQAYGSNTRGGLCLNPSQAALKQKAIKKCETGKIAAASSGPTKTISNALSIIWSHSDQLLGSYPTFNVCRDLWKFWPLWNSISVARKFVKSKLPSDIHNVWLASKVLWIYSWVDELVLWDMNQAEPFCEYGGSSPDNEELFGRGY